VDHRVALPGRHTQLSSADNLCRQLGDLINGVMNQKENETGKQSKAWTHSIDTIRTELNKYREKRLNKQMSLKGSKFPVDLQTYEYPVFDNSKISKSGNKNKLIEIKPKYKVGDLVNVLYNEPYKFSLNKNGEAMKQNTKSFRMGDLRLSKKKYKISKVLYYSGNPPYRYLLDGYPVNSKQSESFTEEELKQV